MQSLYSYGQISTTDDEIDKLSQKVINLLHNKRKIKRVVVADFTYKGRKNTRIGKYLADELSNGIMRNGANFSIISREKARPELMAEAKKQDPKAFGDITSGAIDVLSEDKIESEYEAKKDKERLIDKATGFFGKMLGNKKILKRKDIIIYGTIEDKGDYLRVLLEMMRNDGKAETIGGGLGNFLKTPEIRAFLRGQVPVATAANVSPRRASPTPILTAKSPNNLSEIFKHKDIAFEVIGCTQNNREIECKINILSSEEDVLLTMNKQGTRIIDANGSHEFQVSEIKLADKSLSGYYNSVQKTLLENISIEATLRFSKVKRDIQSIARMEISSQAGRKRFIVKLNNIPVN